MWQKMIVFLFLIPCLLYAQNAPQKKSPIPGPVMKKKMPPIPKDSGKSTARKPPQVIKQQSAAKISKSSTFTTETKKRLVASRNMVYIYPPYVSAWEQRWTEGTGHINACVSSPDGYTVHSSSSYESGMASTRCWVGFYYIPTQTGWHEIGLESYQEGTLQIAVQGHGEAYAYRNIGIWVEGVGDETKLLEEIHAQNPVGLQTRKFQGWNGVSKAFYLKAGQKYWFGGYSEIGGWSFGSDQNWQMVTGNCSLAPFSIQFLRP